MNKDEARRLLGVYAMGSLTEAERTALFQAALEDQELFEELAGEHAMKEVLDEPGARQRLLAVLAPPRRHRAWVWAAAAATIVLAIVLSNRRQPPPPPQQIAQVVKSAEPVVPAEPVAPPELPPEPPPLAIQRKVQPAPAPVVEAPKVAANGPPVPPQAKPEAMADSLAVQGFAAGARGGGAVSALRAQAEAATVTLGFGFSYTVLVGGSLQITPAEPGYLTVIAGDRVVFPSSPVPEFMPITIAVPSGASSLIIGFSRMPAVTGTPVRRDALTGRETDQDPPNGRILIQLSLTPATQ